MDNLDFESMEAQLKSLPDAFDVAVLSQKAAPAPIRPRDSGIMKIFAEKKKEFEREFRLLEQERLRLDQERQYSHRKGGEVYAFLFEHRAKQITRGRVKLRRRITSELNAQLELAKEKEPRHKLALACLRNQTFLETLKGNDGPRLQTDFYEET